MKNVIAIACTSLLIGCVDEPRAPDLDETDEVDQESICGRTNDAQHVNSYNGTLGPSIAFVQANKGSKGAMESTNSDSQQVKYCSGTLIAADLFLTAGHCVDASTVGDFVAFNYERAAGST